LFLGLFSPLQSSKKKSPPSVEDLQVTGIRSDLSQPQRGKRLLRFAEVDIKIFELGSLIELLSCPCAYLGGYGSNRAPTADAFSARAVDATFCAFAVCAALAHRSESSSASPVWDTPTLCQRIKLMRPLSG
jgi:hypothetical protein